MDKRRVGGWIKGGWVRPLGDRLDGLGRWMADCMAPTSA